MSDSDDDVEKMLEEKAALERKILAALEKREQASHQTGPATAVDEKPATTSDIMDAYFKEREGKGKRKRKTPSKKVPAASAPAEPEQSESTDFFDNAPKAKPKGAKSRTATVEPDVSHSEQRTDDAEHSTNSSQSECDFKDTGKKEENNHADAEKQGLNWGKLALGVGKVIGQGAKAAAVGIGKVIDDVEKKSQEESKLRQLDVTWDTRLDRDSIFEVLYKQLTTRPIGVKHRWNLIKPVPEYYQVFFEAYWEEHSDNWTFWTKISMQMTFQSSSSGTSVHCQYQKTANNLMNNCSHADQLIRNTNYVIREVCYRGY